MGWFCPNQCPVEVRLRRVSDGIVELLVSMRVVCISKLLVFSSLANKTCLRVAKSKTKYA